MKSTGREPDPAFDRLVARGLAREIDASGNACPDADLLAAWFDHALSALESERVEAHAAACEWCQQILAALARSEPEVIRAAPLPAPARAWHWHWRWAVPLATAILVVIVGTRTLRAPGPVKVLTTPVAQEARLQKAVEPPVQTLAAAPPPAARPASAAPAARNEPAPAVAARVALNAPEAGTTGAPAASAFGATGGRPARLETATVAAPAVGAAPSALKAESRMAEQAQRQADVASDKMLKVAAPSAALRTPPVPPVAESVAVSGGAPRQGFPSLNVRQASVTTSMLSGSAVSWRFGQDGVIEKSSDRGQTWVRQSSGVTTALSDASAPSDRVCWIVGAGGVVLRTTDGMTWHRLTPPTGADLVAVHAWNDLSATVTASDRSDYETTDGGQSWTRRR